MQFSHEDSYPLELLNALEAACSHFKAALHVRFYGHYGKGGGAFDAGVLRYIPSVRSLGLDCLTHVSSLEEIGKLQHLECFTFGVFDYAERDLLEMRALCDLKQLILSDTRKNQIDLAPLLRYGQLEYLHLNGQANGISAVGELQALRTLSLGQKRKVDLAFVRNLRALQSLRLILGGRASLSEVANSSVEELEILRVQGLSDACLEGFSQLRQLRLEDQLRVVSLDLQPVRNTLQTLAIANCKNLAKLSGLESMACLEDVRIVTTRLNLDAVFDALSESVRGVSFFPGGVKENARWKCKSLEAGYQEARFFSFG